MPIDPQIARGYQGGNVNAIYDARAQRQRMDSFANEDRRRNAMFQQDTAQFQQQTADHKSRQHFEEKWAELQAVKKAPPQVQAQWYAEQSAIPEFAQTPYANLPPEQALPMMEAGLAAMLGIKLQEPAAAPQQPQVISDRGYQYLWDPSKGVQPGSVQAPQRAPMAAPREPPKPSLVDVSLPDGTTQKQWLRPGETSGTPVGAPVRVDPKADQTADKKKSSAGDVLSILNEAEPLIQAATGSYGGYVADQAARVFGASTSGAQATAKLKALQAALMLKMPRMEGPQSDRDVQLYREAAGQIGDPTVPSDTKLAAVESIRALNEQYAGVPAGSSKPAPSAKSAPAVGANEKGYIFIGGDPADKKNWVKTR